MEAPKIDEGLREQIRREFAEIDLDELLQSKPHRVESEERKGANEGSKEKPYTIEESKEQIMGLFSQL